MIKILQQKTKVDGNLRKEIKLEIDLDDLQQFYTDNGEDATCMAIGKHIMKIMNVNKPKTV